MNLYIDDIDCDTYIGETHGLAKMSISQPAPTPSIPTTLGSRIDNKATVVGVLQDHEGNDYVLAVVDAAYRSGSPMAWSVNCINTSLQDNFNVTAILADHHTGKYNTDLILDTYTPTDYPAFNSAKNACNVTVGSNTYYSVLPSINELNLLYINKIELDTYDPTLSQYSSRSISNFVFGGDGSWSSNEKDSNYVWYVHRNGNTYLTDKDSDEFLGVCPVICIPLD